MEAASKRPLQVAATAALPPPLQSRPRSPPSCPRLLLLASQDRWLLAPSHGPQLSTRPARGAAPVAERRRGRAAVPAGGCTIPWRVPAAARPSAGPFLIWHAPARLAPAELGHARCELPGSAADPGCRQLHICLPQVWPVGSRRHALRHPAGALPSHCAAALPQGRDLVPLLPAIRPCWLLRPAEPAAPRCS